MTQADSLTVLAIGFGVFLGALQLNPRHRFAWLLVIGGWCIIVWDVVELAWNSDPYTWFVVSVGVCGLGLIAGVFALENYRSANVQDYIHIWERNFENWDGGTPNSRRRLTETHNDETVIPIAIQLPFQNCPAKFTPVFQSLHDTIEEGACAWLTINGSGLQFENDELKEWRPVLSDTSQAGQFVGHIDKPIYPGKSKVGPDGVIKVNFPVGVYTVNYKIEGESRKGCSFCREGSFVVQIYDATKTQRNPGIPNPSTPAT